MALSVPIGTVAKDVSFADKIGHVILPALTLSLIGISNICMHTRQKVIEILTTDYVLFAKARGENKKSILFQSCIKECLPSGYYSSIPVFQRIVWEEPYLLNRYFHTPGLGRATVQAGLKGDLPLLMGIVIISLIFVYIGNTSADLLYRVIDPRIREAQKV